MAQMSPTGRAVYVADYGEGCHFRSPELSSTDGLTQDRGQRPPNTSAISRPTRRLDPTSNLADAEATWAVSVTFSIPSRGLLGSGRFLFQHIQRSVSNPTFIEGTVSWLLRPR